MSQTCFLGLPSTPFQALFNGIGFKKIGAAVPEKFAIRSSGGYQIADFYKTLAQIMAKPRPFDRAGKALLGNDTNSARNQPKHNLAFSSSSGSGPPPQNRLFSKVLISF
jgi:hypothetical protein